MSFRIKKEKSVDMKRTLSPNRCSINATPLLDDDNNNIEEEKYNNNNRIYSNYNQKIIPRKMEVILNNNNINYIKTVNTIMVNNNIEFVKVIKQNTNNTKISKK
eukprot:307629_1